MFFHAGFTISSRVPMRVSPLSGFSSGETSAYRSLALLM